MIKIRKKFEFTVNKKELKSEMLRRIQKKVWQLQNCEPVTFENSACMILHGFKHFSPTRPSGPSWSSSQHVRVSVCLSVCVFVPFPCNFF